MNFCNGFYISIFNCTFYFYNSLFIHRFVSAPGYRKCHATTIFCICNNHRWKWCFSSGQCRENHRLYRSYDGFFCLLKYGGYKFLCCLFAFIRCGNGKRHFTVPHSVKWAMDFALGSDKSVFTAFPCKRCTIFSFCRKCKIVIYSIEIADIDSVQILLNDF